MIERDVEVAVAAARRAFDDGGWPLLRPAERAPALDRLAGAFGAAEFPPGVFNLVPGTAEVGEMLAAPPGVDTLAVAGPTPAGRRIAAICGQTLKPVTLELGGKSAAIVLDDVDLSAAAAELGSLCFANSGQACFTMSRVLAPRARYDEAGCARAAHAP